MAESCLEWEWDVEVVAIADTEDDEIGNVLEHNFQESYADCLKYIEQWPPEDGQTCAVVLVRTDYAWRGDSREWAYCAPDGTLPAHASSAYDIPCHKVPKRYHAEVAKVLSKVAFPKLPQVPVEQD